ncbi:hypothetical protein BDZ91DRAFT_804175 [Kalaharituber pfeilii]|nr:hypothetical protein BDZ91DRAFT_804175 [Kalaharituber pfeilii]
MTDVAISGESVETVQQPRTPYIRLESRCCSEVPLPLGSPVATRKSRCHLESRCRSEVSSPSPSPFPFKVLLTSTEVKQPKSFPDDQPCQVTDLRRIEGSPSQHIIPEQFLPPGIPQGTHLPTFAQPTPYALRVSIPLSETLTQPLRVPPPPLPVLCSPPPKEKQPKSFSGKAG